LAAPTNKKETFIELRAQGYSYECIAKELNISKQTAINWSKELEIELHNAKTLALNTLLEKLKLSHWHRVSAFGEQLLKIREELSKRSLADIPTVKLFELFIQMQREAKEFSAPLELKEYKDIYEFTLPVNEKSWQI
jgi:hypothetical protein